MEWWGDMTWPQRAIQETCDLRLDTCDTECVSDNWEEQYQQLHCDLWIKSDRDRIRNSCEVYNSTNAILSPCQCVWTFTSHRPLNGFDNFDISFTILTIFNIFGQFQQFWTISTILDNFENWDNFWQLERQSWRLDIWDTDYNSDNWEPEFRQSFLPDN